MPIVKKESIPATPRYDATLFIRIIVFAVIYFKMADILVWQRGDS